MQIARPHPLQILINMFECFIFGDLQVQPHQRRRYLTFAPQQRGDDIAVLYQGFANPVQPHKSDIFIHPANIVLALYGINQMSRPGTERNQPVKFCIEIEKASLIELVDIADCIGMIAIKRLKRLGIDEIRIGKDRCRFQNLAEIIPVLQRRGADIGKYPAMPD